MGSKVFHLSAGYVPYSGKFQGVQFLQTGDLPTFRVFNLRRCVWFNYFQWQHCMVLSDSQRFMHSASLFVYRLHYSDIIHTCTYIVYTR